MTMDRPRRGSRRTSDQNTGKDTNARAAWRGHEPQWFKDQLQHDDQRVEMERGTGEPALGPEEHTHAEGHHWQAARSGHDEAAARGYGGPPRAAALARSRRTEVLDDDSREGGEFQARDDKDDERPRDEEQEKQTRARKGSKAQSTAKMRPDGLDQAERRKMRAAGDEDEAESETADADKARDGGESSARKRGDKATARVQVTKAARKPVRKAAPKRKVAAAKRAPKRAAAVRKNAPKRATKAAGAKRKAVAKSTRTGAAKARTTTKARPTKKAAPKRTVRATAGKAKRKTKAPAARRRTKMARKR